jgi:hypothetical protein
LRATQSVADGIPTQERGNEYVKSVVPFTAATARRYHGTRGRGSGGDERLSLVDRTGEGFDVSSSRKAA